MMKPLLFTLSIGYMCLVTSCKQEQKQASPFNESVCQTVQKVERTKGISDLADPGETRTVSLCEEELLKNGIPVEGAYGSYWKETFNPALQQLSINNFFTLSHKVSPDAPENDYSQWQGFSISNVYYPKTKTGAETENRWGALAGGGLMDPYIPFPLEPKAQMAEGVVGVPFLVAQWNNGNENSLEDITKKFNEKDFSCWIKLGQTEDYLSRGFYINLPSISPDISDKHVIIRGVDSEGKFSRATIKTPLVVTVNGDAESKNKWRWVDLSRLGKIRYLVFQIGTTQNGETAASSQPMTYSFCIDALTAEK